MRLKLLLASSLLISTFSINAQQRRTCGTHDRYLQAVQADPSIAVRRAAKDQEMQEWIKRHTTSRTSSGTVLVTVPVVVHVLYYNSTQNISNAQILSQLDVLNKDYSKTNTDTGLVPSVFKPLAADVQVQFCLANVDPSGNPTTGIETRAVTTTQIGNGNKYYQYSQGGMNAWDHTKYLNFWICDIDGGSTLGYTYLPGSIPASQDGVVIDYRFWGTTGTVSAPYDLGRTASHEVGHWFNLEHIWADEAACAADDGVADTPQQKGENYGCPTFPQTTSTGGRCSTTDPSSMYMNYMDYTDDACMMMFTVGQVARMQAAITAYRSGLLTSNGCSGTTGIRALNTLATSIYPNPSQGVFEFTILENAPVALTITDLTGREVFSHAYDTNEKTIFNLSNQADGIYIAAFECNGKRSVRRIIKN